MDIKSKPKVSNHYCSKCKGTNKHSETETTASCHRCGTIKHHNRLGRPVKKSFEDLLKVALGIISEEADEPKEYKPDGEKKKSAEGAHRPDKGVEFYQMGVDERILYKQNHDTLKP